MTSTETKNKHSKEVLTCLEDFGQFRITLNERLTRRISDLYADSYLCSEILQRIEKGRKIRSLLFLKTAKSLSSHLQENELLDICLSIEMCHAASILVDDILDGDDIRHGHQSSQVSLGTPASALQAHFLCSEALGLVLHHPEILKLLVKTYKRLTLAEMYDVLMVEPLNTWICNGYTEQIYGKTSALFEYSFASAALIAQQDDHNEILKKIGHAIGKLYQLSNDYYDLNPNNLRRRHSNGQSWRITFSFPLAIYLRIHGISDVKKEIDQKMLSYQEWLKFLEKIWTKDVHEFAKDTLNQAEKDAEECISALSLPADVKMQFSCLVHLIVQEDFWYHAYDAQ